MAPEVLPAITKNRSSPTEQAAVSLIRHPFTGPRKTHQEVCVSQNENCLDAKFLPRHEIVRTATHTWTRSLELSGFCHIHTKIIPKKCHFGRAAAYSWPTTYQFFDQPSKNCPDGDTDICSRTRIVRIVTHTSRNCLSKNVRTWHIH